MVDSVDNEGAVGSGQFEAALSPVASVTRAETGRTRRAATDACGSLAEDDLQVVVERLCEEDRRLHATFAGKLVVNPGLNRRLVSFQGNKRANGHRWCNYKEGFSRELIRYVFHKAGPATGRILDPFAGSGTALFAASDLGLEAVGIELLPNSLEIMEVRRLVRQSGGSELARSLRLFARDGTWEGPGPSAAVPDLRITQGAYPPETQRQLGRYVWEARQGGDEAVTRVLLFAAMCVLETVSFTRKDGQYLRWDWASGRHSGKKPFHKGVIPGFSEAVRSKLAEIAGDIEEDANPPAASQGRRGNVTILPGSCLGLLQTLPSASFDGIITSPPYCNRYDYTRTYALELAYLGVTESGIRELRQEMLSCTVENREKADLPAQLQLRVWENARHAFEGQALLQSILSYLDGCRARNLLNNPGIARMVRNYFLELSLVVSECARILRPGSPLVMVNDNVQYQGVSVPVDLILSDIAQALGFEVETIWVLPRGKGNSSQQMGLHGRREARKCVYVWRRAGPGECPSGGEPRRLEASTGTRPSSPVQQLGLAL
ncbi:MAG: site-specific DNA-methyltransferase [Chloroflexi bacterium]|nr:site-specific DNA-methyltransferase [Chloroflexota bacterium]